MEKKKIVVTDPCYIMSHEDWTKCGDAAEKQRDEHKREWEEAFHEIVTQRLTELSGHKAYATSTGFGDWDNDIDGQSFCADSGMVCVCYLTDEMQKMLDESPNKGIAAIITVEGDIKVNFDYSNLDWTVVEIEDSAGNFFRSSDPCDGEDEDEEYEDEED